MKFHTNTLLFIFLFKFHDFHLCEAIEFRNDCPKDASQADKTILKLMFLIDMTKSFAPVQSKMYSVIPEVFKQVKDLYPDNEGATAVFVDYPKSDNPDVGDDEKSPPHSYKEGCYSNHYYFTNQPLRYLGQTIREFKPLNNGGKESSLHALAQSSVSKWLHWERNTEGKTVKKGTVLLTERGYGNISNPGNKKEYVGDGSDMCATSKPATIEKVGQILKREDIAVIGVLPFGSFEPDVLQTYEQYFQQMPGVPFCGKTFNMATESNSETIMNSIMSCLKQVC